MSIVRILCAEHLDIGYVLDGDVAVLINVCEFSRCSAQKRSIFSKMHLDSGSVRNGDVAVHIDVAQLAVLNILCGALSGFFNCGFGRCGRSAAAALSAGYVCSLNYLSSRCQIGFSPCSTAGVGSQHMRLAVELQLRGAG